MSDQEAVVEVRGERIVLRAPKSVGLCVELAMLAGTHLVRGDAAALGLCWFMGGSPGVPGGNPEHKKHALLAYADEVIEELFARGWTVADLAVAGMQARRIVGARLPLGEAVKQTANFSESEEASTSS